MGNTENDRSGSANDMTFKDAGTLDVTLPAFDILKEKILAVAGTGEKPDQILLAAEEAFVNIVSYSGASFISYELSKSGGRLTLVLIDDGVPFDPFIERPVKDFDEFDTGGMGILLIRQIVETASWNRKGEKNVLTLVFAL